mgnify:CR=1 FL=1
MPIPEFYSLASPTDKLINDKRLIDKIFNPMDISFYRSFSVS